MTDVTLREHLESQMKWLDRYFADQIRTIDANTAKAAVTIDKRLEGMNEFRDALRDTAALQATKDEVRSLEKQLDARLKALELNKANFEGKSATVSIIAASGVSILIVAISHYFR